VSGAITEWREQLATVLTKAMGPNVPVYPEPPANITAPCVVIGLGEGTLTGHCTWDVTTTVTAMSGGGDNQPILGNLETVLEGAALALWAAGVRGDWEAPTQATYAGQTVLAATFRTTRPIQLGA
jgi:hypothetical protein